MRKSDLTLVMNNKSQYSRKFGDKIKFKKINPNKTKKIHILKRYSFQYQQELKL